MCCVVQCLCYIEVIIPVLFCALFLLHLCYSCVPRMPPTKKAAPKRKNVVLTLPKKLELLKKLDAGASGNSLAREYGIGKSTVCDIKRKRQELMKFSERHLPSFRPAGAKAPKTMRLGKFENLDEAVFK